MGRGLRQAVGALATAAAATVALAAGLALAGFLDWRLDVLTHFAPGYVIVALAAMLVGAVAGAPWRGRALALGAATIVATAGLMAPEYLRKPEPPTASTPGQIRIVQFNAFKRNIDIDRAATWIVAQKPDIVTLQEVRHDLRDELIRRTGWEVAGRKEHVMILSREKRLRMVRPPIGTAPLTYLSATYPSESGPFEVVTTHFDWPTYDTHGQQHVGLVRVVRQLPRERMIVTGDFNATPWSYALRRTDRDLGLSRRDRALFSFPTRLWRVDGPPPLLPIDHIYAGPGWRTVSLERGPTLGSDHYPLVITLAPVGR